MRRIFASVMGLALAAGSLGLVGTPTASASTTPTMTVTPNTGLTANQKVAITGSGFAPNATLAAVECIGSATTTAGCNLGALAPINVSSTGTVSANFYVQTGPIGSGSCGTSAADAKCLIAIGTLAGVLVADATITFATAPTSAGPSITVTPATGLKNGQTVTITGSGFVAGDSLFAVECLTTATSSAGCSTAGATPITAKSDGTLPSTTFTVATGTIGTGTCGTSANDLAGCVISVSTLSNTDAAFAPITFAAASTGPSITVTPATGLKNAQTVTITGSGFVAGDSLFAVECLTTATSSAGCNTAGATPITAKSDGTLPSTTFTVATGPIGTGTCGTSANDLAGCVISVSTLSNTDAAFAPITFAALASPTVTVTPATGLKNAQTVTITGSGFVAGDSLFAVECLTTATSSADCNTAGATPITANSDGTLPSTTFTVKTGTIGSGACGTTAANAHGCAITVATIAGADAGAAPIGFAVAAARVARTLFVRPVLNLHNGQVVTVFGRGFVPRDHVYIVECLAGARGAAGCDLKTLRAVTVRPNGVLPATRFRVVTGKIGAGFCGTSRVNLRRCTISVANVSKGDSKVVRIAFRLP